MAENIVILGAGASADAGAPLMGNFFDLAERQLLQGGFDTEEREEIAKVFESFSELYKIYAKATLDSRNLEAFFGAIEMARITESFGVFEKERVEEIYTGLIKMIVRTLDNSIEFNNHPLPIRRAASSLFHPEGSYPGFVADIASKGTESFAIITFNYDVALDFELFARNIEFDYALEKQSPSQALRLLKLHGSSNWAVAEENKGIKIYSISEFMSKRGLTVVETAPHYSYARLPISKHLQDVLPSKKVRSLVIPPTWTKSEYRDSIAMIWKQAAVELSEAKNIYVVGYSLPETDSFFRYLYALGTISPRRIERFWVFNQDQGIGMFRKYQELIGDTVKDRFFYFPYSFLRVANVTKQEVNRAIGYYDDFEARLEKINEQNRPKRVTGPLY